MDGLILAFQVFTRLPINKPVDFTSENLRKALHFLPLMGLVIGGLTGLSVGFFARKSSPVGSAAGLVLYFVLSGGLHLDGLADMADGFMANKDRDKTLEIMKDSLIGAFGTMVLILYFICKFALYSQSSANIILKLALVSFLSRLTVLLTIKEGPLAKDEGFGARMHQAIKDQKSIYVLCLLAYLALIALDYRALIPIAMANLARVLVEGMAKSKIGGLTGDIYGALIEINELVILFSWGV